MREKLDRQAAEIRQLQRDLQSQADLIERDRREVDALRKEIDLASNAVAKPPLATDAAVIVSDVKVIGALPKAVQSVETSNGKVRFSGLLQGWYAGGNAGFHDTFRIRRAELKLIGDITPKARWTVMIDPSRALSVNNIYTSVDGARIVADTSVNQAGRILQDAFITLDYVRNVHISVGQFKVPLGLEGMQSSAKLDTVERALFASDRARGGALGDVRDIGVMLYGPATSNADYQVGLFNGSGENQNDLDKNDQKAVIGRFVFRPPFAKGLQVGSSGAWGNGDRPDRPRRDRIGAEVLFVHGPVTLKSELMTGTDSTLHRRGYYTHFGYAVQAKIEPIFRFDVWDPNTGLESDAANVTERDYVAGLNYHISESNLRLQVAYLRKTFAHGIALSRNVVLVNLQAWW